VAGGQDEPAVWRERRVRDSARVNRKIGEQLWKRSGDCEATLFRPACPPAAHRHGQRRSAIGDEELVRLCRQLA
jgi:hypothetical protein